MSQEFYNEAEAEKILRLATRQSLMGGLSRDDLLRTAAEVGLSEQQVTAAEEQLRATDAQDRLAERFRQLQRGRFAQAILSYLGVNAFMIGIWWMSGRGYFWPGWTLVGMGLGAFEEIPKCLLPTSASYRASFERWKAKGAPEVEPEEDDEAYHRRRGAVIGAAVRSRRRNRFRY